MHTPQEICVDSFQAARFPEHAYRTAPLGGLFAHQKGGFYHDGRFATLPAVVDHYNACLSLNLSAQERNDLVQYLLSLVLLPPEVDDAKTAVIRTGSVLEMLTVRRLKTSTGPSLF